MVHRRLVRSHDQQSYSHTNESSSCPPLSLQNKSQIGKVDEILGPINQVYFTIKMDPGMQATSFKPEDKVYIAGDKLLPIERFLPKPKVVQKGESYLTAAARDCCTSPYR